eukprot:1148520-Pelagomonas_calceolata.AAC.6
MVAVRSHSKVPTWRDLARESRASRMKQQKQSDNLHGPCHFEQQTGIKLRLTQQQTGIKVLPGTFAYFSASAASIRLCSADHNYRSGQSCNQFSNSQSPELQGPLLSLVPALHPYDCAVHCTPSCVNGQLITFCKARVATGIVLRCAHEQQDLNSHVWPLAIQLDDHMSDHQSGQLQAHFHRLQTWQGMHKLNWLQSRPANEKWPMLAQARTEPPAADLGRCVAPAICPHPTNEPFFLTHMDALTQTGYRLGQACDPC